MLKRNFVLAGVLSSVALATLHCGGTQNQTPAPSTPPIATKTGAATSLTAQDAAACKQFFDAVDKALPFHLTRNPSQRSAILAAGFKDFMADASDDENKSATDALLKKYGDSISDCSPFVEASSTLKLKDKAKDGNPLVITLRWGLIYTLKAMDYNSHFDDPSVEDDSHEDRVTGAGLILHQRTDYQIERKPNYLVVDGFAEGAPTQSPEIPKELGSSRSTAMRFRNSRSRTPTI